MIVFVAPYSPTGTPAPKLGAARKIENIISALYEIDKNIVFVNTAHNFEKNEEACLKEITISSVKIKCIFPRNYKKRTLGKFLNIYQVNEVCSKIGDIGIPDVVWVYNGYALESRIAEYFSKKYKSKYIIEFEDWIFSRGRGLNPKPFFDYFYWNSAFKYCDYAFCVSSGIVDIVKNRIPEGRFSEFPGLISKSIEQMDFGEIKNKNKYLVGYFGGLNDEKGADILLEAIKNNKYKDSLRFKICGAGNLFANFERELSKGECDFDLHTNLTADQLLYEMDKCDFLVNPHKVSDGYINGLFPSKVIEYIGTGKVIVSTELPRLHNKHILDSVEYFDGSADGMFEAIIKCVDNFKDFSLKSRNSALSARDLYGYSAFLNKVDKIIHEK